MNNSGNSKWVCVKSEATDCWFTVGKTYVFNLKSDFTVTDNVGYRWSLLPSGFTPNVEFKEVTFHKYLEQVEL